jgi:hypothetical protein
VRRDEQPLPPAVQAYLDGMGGDVRLMRRAADVTQRQLEGLAAMDQGTISRVERGLIPRLPLHRYARLRAAVEGRLGPVPRRPPRRRRVDHSWD